LLTDEDISALLSTNFNFYPDGSSPELRAAISQYTAMPEETILCGNGADELIKIIFDSTIAPGDKVLIHTPTFSQYGLNATINEGIIIEVPSKSNLSINTEGIIDAAKIERPKLIFLCTPNNPTGAVLSEEEIISILDATDALVVVDEAYFEFYGKTIVKRISQYSNLIVLRTLSKAFSLAGLRVGYLISSEENISILNRVRMPYNLNSISCKLGVIALSKRNAMDTNITNIIDERNRMESELENIPELKLFKSNGNFLFLISPYADAIREGLLRNNVSVRKFSSAMLNNSLRISVADERTNTIVLTTIKEVLSNGKASKAS